jgi:hypothetical protein
VSDNNNNNSTSISPSTVRHSRPSRAKSHARPGSAPRDLFKETSVSNRSTTPVHHRVVFAVFFGIAFAVDLAIFNVIGWL